MPLTAKYNLTLVLVHLAAALNASAYWRALVSAPDSTEEEIETIASGDTSGLAEASLAQIKLHLYDPDQVESRPFFLVRHLTDTDIARFGTTGWETRGQLLMTCEFETPTAYRGDLEQAGHFFCNALGRILDEVKTGIEQSPAGKLNVTAFDVHSVGKIDPDEINGLDVWGGNVLARYLD